MFFSHIVCSSARHVPNVIPLRVPNPGVCLFVFAASTSACTRWAGPWRHRSLMYTQWGGSGSAQNWLLLVCTHTYKSRAGVLQANHWHKSELAVPQRDVLAAWRRRDARVSAAGDMTRALVFFVVVVFFLANSPSLDRKQNRTPSFCLRLVSFGHVPQTLSHRCHTNTQKKREKRTDDTLSFVCFWNELLLFGSVCARALYFSNCLFAFFYLNKMLFVCRWCENSLVFVSRCHCGIAGSTWPTRA